MRVRALAVVVLIALAGSPACSRGGGDDDGYRLELDGRARITSSGDDRTVENGKHALEAGDTVRMLSGDAVLGLPGDRAVLLRSRDGDASTVRVASAPDVIDGDAVVVAGSDGMRFTAGDVDVQIAEGAARVQRGLGVTIAVYEGSAKVHSAGRELAGGLPALRQVSVAATGLLPRLPVPLVYDDKQPDPWDQRFLGDAIDLGLQLDSRARGLTGQLGPQVTVAAPLLQRALPPLAGEPWLSTKLGSVVRSAGEALVGGAIAIESGGSLADSWDDVFSFRDAGARWGLVALDQRVQRDAVLDRLRDALDRSPILFAAAPRQSTSGGSTTTTSPGTQQPSGGGSTTTPPQAPDTTPDTTPEPTVPPATIPPITIPPLQPESPPGQSPEDPGDASPPDLTTVIDDIVDLVEDLTTPPATVPPLP